MIGRTCIPWRRRRCDQAEDGGAGVKLMRHPELAIQLYVLLQSASARQSDPEAEAEAANSKISSAAKAEAT